MSLRLDGTVVTMSGRRGGVLVLLVLVAGLLAVATCTCAYGQEVAEVQPGERYAAPFPDLWLRWIFDERIVSQSRQGGQGHEQATEPGDLQLAVVLWPGHTITAGEPLLARVSITNPAEERVFLPFIGGLGDALHFEVTDAAGTPVGRVYEPPRAYMDGPVEAFPAESTKSYETAVSYWYDFSRPGEYTVDARLIVVDHLQGHGDPVVLSSQTMAVTVLPRDPDLLAERCAQFFMAHLGGKQEPVPEAEGSDYRPSREACRRALLHVRDEVALPYLEMRHSGDPDVVTAISWVDSPKAIEVLRRIARTARERARERAEQELARLGAGIEPEAQPQAPLPPPVAVSALIETLCDREGLALVADLAAADAETEVRVDPAAGVAEIAVALDAAGLRAWHSAGGRALVILGPADGTPPDPLADRYVTASRLLATVTVEQLQHREMGYIRSAHLTEEQIALLYELLGPDLAPGGRRHDQAPVSKLAMGLGPLSGFDIVVRHGDGAALGHSGGQGVNGPPPASLLPEPTTASALWWYWPYALSERAAERTVYLAPLRGDLQDLLAVGEEPLVQWVALDEVAAGLTHPELLASARGAPLGHLLWALEVATGLQTVALSEADLAEWSLSPVRRLHSWRPERVPRLPSLQCHSPHRTPAGAAMLALIAPDLSATGPAFQAYDMAELPEWLRTLITDSLPPPRHLDLPADITYEPQSENDRVMVYWPEGVHIDAVVLEPNGSGGGTEVLLPVF